MKKINYKKDAICVAQDLLGKVICYDGKKYMITVTEAYPYKEEKDKNGNEISYVNRYKSGTAHDMLTNEEKIGTWFAWADMLHVVCGGDKTEGEYRCGNVLIRGAILIENGKKMHDENRYLNYKEGRPIILCKEKLKMLTGNNWKADEIIIDNESVSDKIKPNDIKEDKRVNLKSDNRYRFYLDLDELKSKK